MKVTGAATLSRPPGAVWSALNDPAVLARAIPGCEGLDVTGPGACTLTVRAGIAAVAGSYSGEAKATERAQPGLIRATVSGSGNRGQVGADLTVRLGPSGDAATQVSYEADVHVEGPLAAVGQLVLASVAKRLAAQFLAGVESAVAAEAADRTEAASRTEAAGWTGTASRTEAADRAEAAGLAEAASRTRAEAGASAGAAASSDGPARADAAPRADVPAWSELPAGVRAGLVAGAAAGLAGVALGVLIGRRARTGRH